MHFLSGVVSLATPSRVVITSVTLKIVGYDDLLARGDPTYLCTKNGVSK
jgi:hypothetical protein